MSDLISHFHQGHESFTIIPHHLFQINYLKPDEKYLLMWFKSRPPSFRINQKSLATNLGVGVDVIKRMSHNLQKKNHLYIKKLSTGQSEWHFFEKPEDCLHFASPLKSPQVENPPKAIEKPQVEKPKVDNPPALTSIDLVTNIDPKILCPSDDVLKVSAITYNFELLWQLWPNSKQRIVAKTAFKSVLSRKKIKTADNIIIFANKLKNDIEERLRLTENMFDDGLRAMMFSTYLNKGIFDEALPAKPVDVSGTDEAAQANKAKNKELFGR